jgi:flagellar protein FliS
MNRDPYSRYQETKVLGADQGRLILMAYDGIIKFLQIATDNLKNKDYLGKGRNIIKAQDLINELLCSLNYEAGEIAINLRNIYLFMINRLTYAETNKDTKSIQDVLKMLYELQKAWENIILNTKDERTIVNKQQEVTQREAVL